MIVKTLPQRVFVRVRQRENTMVEKVPPVVTSSPHRMWTDGPKATQPAFKVILTIACLLNLSFTIFVVKAVREYIFLYLRGSSGFLHENATHTVIIVSFTTGK